MPSTITNTQRIKNYVNLKPNDYVVHIRYGIGRFLGLKTLTASGRPHDYLAIQYRHGSKVYIPIEHLDRVQKYISAGERHPRLSDISRPTWHRTKHRVYRKVRHIASDLVRIYAKRRAEPGYQYPKDDHRQKSFDAQFPYRPTPDQTRSIQEIKHDMEKPYPMDRLLVGDVGYGKTEVALRAAFKALHAGKQVAIMVPTTILAVQHCETCLKRFHRFPVRIGLLSGFSTPQQTRQTLHGIKSGYIQLIIGTHRILSRDVRFHNLGLLIVDEEQRFGVVAKNRIKEHHPKIDVLTLTATPIPRTLNMAMMGVRDLSVIETPPMDRKPIKTYALPELPSVIAKGIRRELKRHGQVFFLHNRVSDIDRVAANLHRLVPEARIAYIDGQMDNHEAERLLLSFVNRKYDILIATTIIETGIDIANANTLFVERADRMGLAQLYQLRGRVGRSSRQAYAYLMYPPHRVLSDTSQKRLATMKKYNRLGAGFHIAMRDLMIRGGGTLLGAKQHGFINSVGYNMYTRLLSQAVERQRKHPQYRARHAIINLDRTAYLPKTYIQSPATRLAIYQQLHQADSDDRLSSLQHQLIARYGILPRPVQNLIFVIRLRLLIKPSPVVQIDQMPKRITLTINGYTEHQLKPLLPKQGHFVFKRIGDQLGLDINTVRPTDHDYSWVGIIRQLVHRLVKLRSTD